MPESMKGKIGRSQAGVMLLDVSVLCMSGGGDKK